MILYDVLKSGKYTLGDYTIYLCTENGGDYAILDGISISIDKSTGDVEFSNSRTESLTLFYYVDATIKKDNADDLNIKYKIAIIIAITIMTVIANSNNRSDGAAILRKNFYRSSLSTILKNKNITNKHRLLNKRLISTKIETSFFVCI